MPNLLRARFVNVGPPRARMVDLPHDYRDEHGHGADSIVLLRNGGGKTTKLRLFFSTLRPKKTDFLAVKGEGGKGPTLEDFVLPNDKSVVALEWELDQAPGEKKKRQRYITGAFYEWRASPNAEGSKFQRIWFAMRVHEHDPRMTLEGLPLFGRDTQGHKTRRTMSGFKDQLTELRKTYPSLDVTWTDNQTTWDDTLDKAGIDTELFLYQIKMNQREGGADALFKFKGANEFIEFLLDLVVDPKLADSVVENIQKFRDAIRQRNEEHRPEALLTAGVITRLAPFADIKERRARARLAAQGLKTELSSTATWATARATNLTTEAKADAEAAEGLLSEATVNEDEAIGLDKRAAALDLLALKHALAQAEEDYTASDGQLRRSTHTKRVWEAAVPLATALSHSEEADFIQRKIDEKKSHLAPLYERLVQIARAYANTTLHTGRLARRHEEGTKAAQRAFAAEEQQHLDHAIIARDRANAAEAKIQEANTHLQNAERERIRLLNRGAIQPEERSADALARISSAIGEESRRASNAEARMTEIQGAITKLRAEANDAANALNQARSQRLAEEKRLEKANERRNRIEAHQLLRRLLDTDRVDIETITADIGTRLDDAHRQASDEAVRLRVESAAENRAITHLQDHGLLPATPEVERLVTQLRAKLGEVVSGWRAIADLLPADSPGRHALVRARPDIAMGIVVRDADTERARAIIQETGIVPDVPIVISGKTAVLESYPEGSVVVGPATDAHFDLRVAQAELDRRRADHEQARSKIAKADEARQELGRLRDQYHHFRDEFPQGWFAQQAALVASLTESERILNNRNAGIATERQDKETQLEDQRRGKEKATQAVQRLTLDKGLIEEYAAHHESREKQQREIITTQQAERMQALADQAAHDAKREAAREQAALLTDVIAKHAEGARQLEDELAAIEYLNGHKPQAAAGDLAALRAEYREYRLDYVHKVGEEALLREKERAQAAAAKARDELNDLLGDGLELAEVEEALAGLPDREQAKRRRKEAADTQASHLGLHGRLQQKRTSAQAALTAASDAARALGELPRIEGEGAPASETDARQAWTQAVNAAKQLRLDAGEKRKRAEQLTAKASKAREAAKALTKDGQQALQLLESAGELLDPVPLDSSSWTPPDHEDEVASRIAKSAPEIQRLRRETSRLNKERDDAYEAVRAWITGDDFARLKTTLASKLVHLEAPRFEDASEHWTKELRVRASWLDDAITRVDKHRDTIVNETLSLAEDGLRSLRAAEAKSTLPQEIPKLGGEKFLRITTHEPPEREAKRDRIGLLVDEIARTGNVPDGAGLIKKAVGELAKPATVKILFPDADTGIEHVDVSVIGNHSGGERLTSAVLLYCALANLRAQRRARFRKPTSVCVLDNPFGTVSRPKFIQLQRAVAAANNIQLIYTTHLVDMEALSVFPNIVRLKNQSVDIHTGHRIIEIDHDGQEKPVSVLESVSVGRREAKPEAGDDDDA